MWGERTVIDGWHIPALGTRSKIVIIYTRVTDGIVRRDFVTSVTVRGGGGGDDDVARCRRGQRACIYIRSSSRAVPGSRLTGQAIRERFRSNPRSSVTVCARIAIINDKKFRCTVTEGFSRIRFWFLRASTRFLDRRYKYWQTGDSDWETVFRFIMISRRFDQSHVVHWVR